MSKIKVNVSNYNLTRCHQCLRHVNVDRTLPEADLLALTCTFCDSKLFTGIQSQKAYQVPFQGVIDRSPLKQKRFGRRGARLAASLLSIGLALAGCEEDETVEAGTEVAGVEIGGTPAGVEAPEYGVEPAGVEVGGTPAGVESPDYGVEPAGVEAGTATDMGVELDMAPDAMFAPEYGVEPALDMSMKK